MSSGGGYQGGRTRMGTKVVLNVYDLSPANDVLYNIGFGLHHSGVEILGTEYSFASGAGIFEDRPKEAGGAKFRESIELGAFEGGQAEVRTIIGDLRSDFGPDAYNLIRKNCNSFANAFVWALLGRSIPGHVNRLADIGVCCSCLLPKKLLAEAPVGPNAGNNSGGGFQPYAGGGPKATMAPAPKAFSGSGATLGSINSGNPNAGGVGGRLLGVIGVGGSASKGKDDLTDRREKARKAALARFEQSGASPPNSASFSTNTTSSSTSSSNNSSSGLKSS